MHHVVYRPVRGFFAFALLIACFVALPAYAAPRPAGIADGVIVAPGSSFALAPGAPPAPAAFGAVGRYGTFVSDAIAYPEVFDTLRVAYESRIPRGAQAALDVRASADGIRWTPWVVDLASGATAQFDQPARFVQYRVRLLATSETPSLRSLRLTPDRSAPSFAAFENAPPPVAPTFTVHATR
ncbi:MAG: hypothetical protein RMJ54_18190, partial [Roseiflexaceae bacterium]|nr:hypothetical protein [Roseiflexaceae bacterium]